MTSTRGATAFAAPSADDQRRPETLECRAEDRMKPETPARPAARAGNDLFADRDGVSYAGTHLLVDLWGVEGIDDVARVEATLCEVVDAVGATLLHVHLHRFTPNGGVSGVAVLAESHISIHTWPEKHYVALDIFVCGECNPYAAIPVLRRAWSPEKVQLSEHKRGLSV